MRASKLLFCCSIHLHLQVIPSFCSPHPVQSGHHPAQVPGYRLWQLPETHVALRFQIPYHSFFRLKCEPYHEYLFQALFWELPCYLLPACRGNQQVPHFLKPARSFHPRRDSGHLPVHGNLQYFQKQPLYRYVSSGACLLHWV